MTPRACRPQFAGYGVPKGPEGMVDWNWARERLVAAHNYWASTVSPHASPIWAVWEDDDSLVFSCGSRSRKARDLAEDPRLVVHLESGAEVVIVEGTAERIDPHDELMDTYSRKYGPTDPGSGLWYRVRPERVFAWREADYPASATRFDF